MFSLEKRNLTSVHRYLMEGNEDKGAISFSVVPTERTRGNGHTQGCMR